jgi:hypothetical protein
MLQAILLRMQDPHQMTTMRVSAGVRDELRGIADRESVTLDQALARLLRADRQRRIGRALARYEPDDDDAIVLDAAASDAASG